MAAIWTLRRAALPPGFRQGTPVRQGKRQSARPFLPAAGAGSAAARVGPPCEHYPPQQARLAPKAQQLQEAQPAARSLRLWAQG